MTKKMLHNLDMKVPQLCNRHTASTIKAFTKHGVGGPCRLCQQYQQNGITSLDRMR